jgi:hypothetical protein
VAGVTLFDCLKPWFFPNRHPSLQLINDPLACSEAFPAMQTCHSNEQGWFSNCDKSNPMMNDDELESKFRCGLSSNSLQLVLRHLSMRLILDSLDLAPILNGSDYAQEVNYRAGSSEIALPGGKRRFSRQNFTNDICHVLKVLATMNPSVLNSHKRRYQNGYESM